MAANFQDYPNLMKPECPWVPLREWGGLPNVKWCEETLCSYVAEPANTWSNLAFIIGAIFLWRVVRGDNERMLKFWAPATFWVGFTSLVYHMTVAFVTQVFDFWGMYFFFGMVLLLNLLRLGKIAKEKFFLILWSSIFGLTGLTVVVAKLGLPVQGIVLVLLVATLATEVWASVVSPTKIKHGFLFAGLAFIGVAFVFSALDATRTWCERDNHIIMQGHAIWHVLDSFGIVCAHYFYRQFRALYV